MGGHRPARPALVLVRQGGAEFERVRQGHLVRHVPAERVVGGGLVRDEVEPLAGRGPGGFDLGGVADQGDRDGLAGRCGGPGPGQGLGRIVGQPIHVADVKAPSGADLVDLDRDAHAVVHRHGQGLGAAHPAEARGQCHRPAQRSAEVLARRLGERLVRALQDALRPDVDPRARGHLAVHHQALALELAEDVPRRPLADEVGVGDQDPRRPRVGPDDADRLAGLDEQRLVVAEPAKLADDGVERLPAPRGAARPAVDDEVIGVLRDLRIEVVHEHPQDRFLLPAAAGQLGPARRAHRSRSVDRTVGWLHARSLLAGRLLAKTGDDLLAEAHARRPT